MQKDLTLESEEAICHDQTAIEHGTVETRVMVRFLDDEGNAWIGDRVVKLKLRREE